MSNNDRLFFLPNPNEDIAETTLCALLMLLSRV